MSTTLYQFKPPFDWTTHFTDGVHDAHYITDANDTGVCRVNHDDRIEQESVNRVVALFAAAPDLLAALEALTEWGCTHTSPRDENSPHELLIAARAAIVKANFTGKECCDRPRGFVGGMCDYCGGTVQPER